MLPRELDYLRSIQPYEEQAKIYEAIIVLYSNYMSDERELREKLSTDIDAVINMPPEQENA